MTENICSRPPGIILETTAHWHAPTDHPVRPAQIPEECETIEILTGGRIIFDNGNGDELFAPGTIFWHVAGEYTIHRFPPGEPYSCLALRFRMPRGVRRHVSRISPWPEGVALNEFVSEAIRRFNDETFDRVIWQEYLYRRLTLLAYSGSRQTRRAAWPPALLRAMELLPEALDETFDVREMARRAEVSEAYLFALFKRHLGTSPHRSILNYRLRMARTRLSDGNDNIKTIAAECGFANIESFYRAFRRNSGFSPGEYRRRQRGFK